MSIKKGKGKGPTDRRYAFAIIMQLVMFVLLIPFTYGVVELVARTIVLVAHKLLIKTTLFPSWYVHVGISTLVSGILVWYVGRDDTFRLLLIKFWALIVAWLITMYSLVDFAHNGLDMFVTSFVYTGPFIATGFAGYMLYLAIQYAHCVPLIATQ